MLGQPETLPVAIPFSWGNISSLLKAVELKGSRGSLFLVPRRPRTLFSGAVVCRMGVGPGVLPRRNFHPKSWPLALLSTHWGLGLRQVFLLKGWYRRCCGCCGNHLPHGLRSWSPWRSPYAHCGPQRSPCLSFQGEAVLVDSPGARCQTCRCERKASELEAASTG